MGRKTVSEGPYFNSNLFSGYYLDNRVQDLEQWDCDDEAREVFEALQDLWESEAPLVETYKEDSLIDSWIDEVVSELGFGTLSETTLPNGGGYNDRLLFGSTDKRRAAALEKADGRHEDMYNHASALLEAKQWDADFTSDFSEDRRYRDASHQVKYYLERTPGNLQWGILTNGRKWRLYGTKDYETQTYYEIDLPELLESGDVEKFKYFYVFFRPGAFRASGGTTFLDTVWNESETAAQELGEDLQDNVFTALRVLGKGFVETNDLAIDPDDDERLDELKEQSLVLLYRLMFILYAESRHLIDPEDPDSQRKYEENFSVDELRNDVLETVGSAGSRRAFETEYSEYSTTMWSRLENLFSLIDSGNDDLGIPAYNGGLFDEDQHEFLTENEVGDSYLAEVIYRLSTTEGDDGFVAADYADLDTRHLGTIYEGLLEHDFRIAPTQYAAVAADGGQVWKDASEVSVAEAVETVESGSLYVVNDDGERKATGAYYTPDYVVTYIVEETVDPLVADIDADLEDRGLERGTQEYVYRFADEVFELKVLDPAMGSGHFLTKATGYLAEQVMERVREVEEAAGLFDEQEIRRRVSRECIYGVDLNGMAVELAKLSMWLETLATDQPLAFLDHHLKAGNSLVGSDISEILATEDAGDGGDGEDGGVQTSVFDWMEQTRKRALEHVMDLMEDLLAIENKNLTDIKEMEETYREIREDPLFTRLLEMASVHTAAQFGLDVPDDADEQMAKALRDDSWDEVAESDWFTSAQAMANTEQFFHWELEFPEVFFGEEGTLSADAGFDAVVGNPPYVKIQNIPNDSKKMYSVLYDVAEKRYDLYSLFVEKGNSLRADRLGYILPNKFFESDAGEPLRQHLADSRNLEKIVDFEQDQVFEGVSTYTCLLFLSNQSKGSSLKYATAEAHSNALLDIDWSETKISGGEKWSLMSKEEQNILNKIEETGDDFEEMTKQIFVGIQTSADSVFVLRDCEVSDGFVEGYSKEAGETVRVEQSITEPYVGGDKISRYAPVETAHYLIYPYSNSPSNSILDEGIFEEKHPKAYDYLSEHREQLENRGGENQEFETWYAHWCPRTRDKFNREKILIPEIVKGGGASFDSSGDVFHSTTVYSPILTDEQIQHTKTVLGILNSSLVWYYILSTGTVLRGGYYRYKTDYLTPLSIPLEQDDSEIEPLVNDLLEFESKSEKLNLSLLDHLAIDPENSDIDGPTITEIGFSQPPTGSAGSILHETTETRTKLQTEQAKIEREDANTVTIYLTARYKPEDDEEDEHELDTYGYTETEFLPALQITDLTETEADLIEAFVPVAVDEAGGFAGFRDNATQTNSLIDRLKKLTLPDVDDVEDGLANYIRTKERADELDAKIEKTDDLIDQIVYELYGLTDEEIEIVEEAVAE
ncbi:Eco57I restriction-modification methylase domain-containing protein [Halorussus amylolyticus]|uniref:Eco57I restriction-modification methylase domain-containing protein n=1 Tax=Halorussus amylolyticus TaxID=1126242 RepID=UPI001049A17D|nr:Eco57I restriction-modification methylase domain-containing protein [Halorussus amylolyticus]